MPGVVICSVVLTVTQTCTFDPFVKLTWVVAVFALICWIDSNFAAPLMIGLARVFALRSC